MSKQGIKLPFFRHTPINEFDKNANSVYGRVYLFYIVLFGDKRSLRFLCVNFGWRTFLFCGDERCSFKKGERRKHTAIKHFNKNYLCKIKEKYYGNRLQFQTLS